MEGAVKAKGLKKHAKRAKPMGLIHAYMVRNAEFAAMLEERTPGAFLNKVCYVYRAGCENSISSRFGAQRREYWYKLMEVFLKRRKRKKIHPLPTIEIAD